MLIAAALKDEIRGILSKMGVDCTVHFKPAVLYRGKAFNKELDLLVTGMGGEKMRKGLEEALSLCSPESILLVGCCGGTTPIVSTGSLVVAKEVIDEKTETRLPCDGKLLERAKKLCEENKWNYQVGGLLTVNRVVAFPHEKADLGASYSAVALEMEAFSLARIAQGRNIPCLAVKAVLDSVEEWLPPLGHCYETAGELEWMQLTQHLLKNPKEMMKLPKVVYWASQARGAVTKFLEGWIGRQ